MAQDDAGQFFIPSFAVNTIGDVDVTNGYQVFISGSIDDAMSNEDFPLVPEILTQTLSPTKLFMIGYPYQKPHAATDVFASIAASVVVVQNDAGQFWIPFFAVNTIGNLQPGRGYQIFVNKGVNFTYPSKASLPVASNAKTLGSPEPRHFKYQRTGLAYGIVLQASEQKLYVGDEVGVFDGDLCVGASVFTGDYPLVIAAWEGHKKSGLRGFEAGARIGVRVWKASDNRELTTIASFANSNESTFRGSAISVMNIGSTEPRASKPPRFSLHQNYPNPFNPETKIRFVLPVGSEVSLTIYNLHGQKIRRLDSGYKETGSYEVIWDGRDDHSLAVPSGVYVVRLQANDFIIQNKMTLLK